MTELEIAIAALEAILVTLNHAKPDEDMSAIIAWTCDDALREIKRKQALGV